MGRRSTISTISSIFQALLKGKTVVQSELAQDLGLKSDTIRGHMEALRRAGVPLERQREGNLVYWSVPSTWGPEGLFLSSDKVQALLSLLITQPRNKASMRIISELLRMFPDGAIWEKRLKIITKTEAPSQASTEIMLQISDAILNHEAILVEYHSRNSGSLRERHLSPQAIQENLYFLAHCHETQILKRFRFDKCKGIAPSKEAYVLYPQEKIDQALNESLDGFSGLEALEDHKFYVNPEVLRRHEQAWALKNADIHREADGSATVSFRVRAVDQVARRVLALGEDTRALTPSLQKAVLRMAQNALLQHENLAAPEK